jgi:Tfp pilus assembly protein PilF
MSRLCREVADLPTRQILVPRLVGIAGTACVLLLGAQLIRDRIGPAMAQRHWDNFLITAREHTQAREVQRRNPVDAEAEQAIDAKEPTELYAAQLEKLIQFHPQDYQAHERMATICLLHFESLQQNSDCPLGLDDLRDAAFASQFKSQEQLDAWLGRALGPRRQLLAKAQWHARCSLAGCPLRGQCYLHLAKLCFLDNHTAATKDALLAQALRVTPAKGEVLFAAGREAMLAGDTEQAAVLWRRCFHSSRTYQKRMIDLFVGRLSAEFLCNTFKADLPALRLLYHRYRELGNPQENAAFLAYYAKVAQEEANKCHGAAAAGLWIELCGLQLELDDYPSAQASAERALACQPSNFDAHFKLAKCLLLQQQFDQSYHQLRWCILRRPNDPTLQRMYEAAERGRLAYKPQEQPSTPSR